MDGFANVMLMHDWWWLSALEHCLAGYGFSHTLALCCHQINDALSISITSYSYMHPGLVWVAVSTLQVHQLNLKHFWALLSLSVDLLYIMTITTAAVTAVMKRISNKCFSKKHIPTCGLLDWRCCCRWFDICQGCQVIPMCDHVRCGAGGRDAGWEGQGSQLQCAPKAVPSQNRTGYN